MSEQRRFHITSASPATTTVIAKNVFVTQVSWTCSDAGTTWKPIIQNKQTPPMILALGKTLDATDVGIPKIASFKDDPILMENGIDILLGGGTPGVLDIWINYRPVQP